MLGGAITYLMEFYPFIQLQMETLSCRTVRWMESRIIAICAASEADFAIPVGTSEASIQDYLLQTLPIAASEIAYEGIIPFTVRKVILLKYMFHRRKIKYKFSIFAAV